MWEISRIRFLEYLNAVKINRPAGKVNCIFKRLASSARQFAKVQNVTRLCVLCGGGQSQWVEHIEGRLDCARHTRRMGTRTSAGVTDKESRSGVFLFVHFAYVWCWRQFTAVWRAFLFLFCSFCHVFFSFHFLTGPNWNDRMAQLNSMTINSVWAKWVRARCMASQSHMWRKCVCLFVCERERVCLPIYRLVSN